MGKLIALIAILLVSRAQAQSLLSIPGLADTVANYAKQTSAVGLIDLNAKVSAGAFLPIRMLKDSKGVNYVELGPGAAIKQGEHLEGGFLLSFNSSAIIRKIEGKSAWYNSHVSKVILPDVNLGLYFFPSLGSDFRWDRWRQYVGGAASIRL